MDTHITPLDNITKITLKLTKNHPNDIYGTLYIGNCQLVMVTDRTTNNFLYQRYVYTIENMEQNISEISDDCDGKLRRIWDVCGSMYRIFSSTHRSIAKIGVSYDDKNDKYVFIIVDKNNGFILDHIIDKEDIIIV